MARLAKSRRAQSRRQTPLGRTAVNTYYRSKDQTDQTSPFKKKPPKKNRRKYFLGIVDFLVVAFLLIGIVNSLLLNSTPKVSVSDTSYHPASYYLSQTKTSFQGFNNRNKVTFDEAGVTRQIQSHLPEVQSVHIELPFLSSDARVRLVISPPAFKLSGNNQVYIVDSSGLAVAKAASLPKIQKLLTVTDQSGYVVNIGRQVLSSQSVGFIEALANQCQRAKVPISSITLPALPQEVDIRTSDQPYFVKFYLGGDINIQAGQFLASRQKLAQSNTTPVEYLDVRVAGKVFYK